jgi:hypothetical protein
MLCACLFVGRQYTLLTPLPQCEQLTAYIVASSTAPVVSLSAFEAVPICKASFTALMGSSFMQAEGVEEQAAAYFRAVRAEAARIPYVCASARRYPEIPVITVDAPAAAAALPQYGWTCTVVDNFMTARAQVHADASSRSRCAASSMLPHVSDRQGWQRYIHQDDSQPLSTTLACMDNTLAAACMRDLVEESEQSNVLSRHVGLWMYGLMVRLEKPVHPNVACVLRQVSLLAEGRRHGLPDPAVSDEAAHELAMYDTLRVLAGGYFGQDMQLAPVVSEYLRCSAQV